MKYLKIFLAVVLFVATYFLLPAIAGGGVVMAMATVAGLKAGNISVGAIGTSWEDLYQINAGSLTNITRANFFVLPLQMPIEYGTGVAPALIIYLGTGAITTTEIDNFPQGTTLIAPNIGTPTIYIKESTTTWNAIT